MLRTKTSFENVRQAQTGSLTAGDAALCCVDWTVGHELCSLSVRGTEVWTERWAMSCVHCQWGGRGMDWTVGHGLCSLSVRGTEVWTERWAMSCVYCQWAGTEVVRHAGWAPIFNCGAKRGTEPGVYFLQLIYLGTRFSFLDEHVWRICLSDCATLSPGIN